MRSLRAASLPALCLGFTGADPFYLRRPVTGSRKLLTLGDAGIWWLIALFRITKEYASEGVHPRRWPEPIPCVAACV